MILLVFLFTSLVGGVGSPLIKFVLETFPTFTLVAIRSFLSIILVLPFVMKKSLNFQKERNLLFLAGFLFATNWIFFAFGIQNTTVIMGQIIYLPTSLLVAIIGHFFLKEKLTSEQKIGLLFAMSGMFLLIFQSVKSSDILSFGTVHGNFLVVIGLVCWSLYTVISRKISNIYSPISITFFNFMITFGVSSVFAFFENFNKPIITSDFTPIAMTALITLVISSILFFYFYQWLIKHTSAFISSLALYLVTLVASILGVVFFNEKITPAFFLGAILIVVGVFLSTSYKYVRLKIKS